MTASPIQTQYMGYKFRSRLEARWAVFFEMCSFTWEYEKEGYTLASGCYLPDFWIENLKLWVEIKPLNTILGCPSWNFADNQDLKHVFDLSHEEGHPACLIEGAPGSEKIYFFATETVDSGGGWFDTDEAEWVSCNGIITLDLHRGREHTIFTNDFQETLPWFTYSQNHPTFKIPVKIAYQEARSARFEHGNNTYVSISGGNTK